MFKLFDRTQQAPPKDCSQDLRTPEPVKAKGMVLHELDYQDVAITPQGAKLVKRAAQSVIDQYMPAVDSAKITVREAMALFVDHVFWEEKTGGLFMCTDVATRAVCLPLPRSHWTIRQSAQPVQ